MKKTPSEAAEILLRSREFMWGVLCSANSKREKPINASDVHDFLMEAAIREESDPK